MKPTGKLALCSALVYMRYTLSSLALRRWRACASAAQAQRQASRSAGRRMAGGAECWCVSEVGVGLRVCCGCFAGRLDDGGGAGRGAYMLHRVAAPADAPVAEAGSLGRAPLISMLQEVARGAAPPRGWAGAWWRRQEPWQSQLCPAERAFQGSSPAEHNINVGRQDMQGASQARAGTQTRCGTQLAGPGGAGCGAAPQDETRMRRQPPAADIISSATSACTCKAFPPLPPPRTAGTADNERPVLC